MNRLCRDSRTHPLLHKRNDIRKPLPGQIGRVVAAVRRALRKIFPDLKLSNAEILEIVAKAKRAVVEGGGRQDVEIAQTRMSRAAGGDDAKQGDIEAMEIQEPARKDLRFSQNLPQPDRAETESARQYRETERVYGGRAAYDKAKADGRTKLTYGQWVQVRTPNFKKWFGDWEAEATAKSIRDLAPVDATNAKEVVTKKDIENYFRNNGAATNALNGVTASFPVATAGKLYHHRGFPVGRIVGRLKEIFEQSVPFLSEKEALKEGHKAHPNIDSFDHYVGKVSLGSGAESGEYYVRFRGEEGKYSPAGDTQCCCE